MVTLLVLVGMAIAVIGAPAFAVWRFVMWKGGEIVAPTSSELERTAQTARVLQVRVRHALFSGLLPGWALGLAMMLLGTFLH